MNISGLLSYVATLRIKHWNADTKSNEHRAIGELYDSMDELLDSFVETYLGKKGGLVSEDGLQECPCTDNSSMISAGRDTVKAHRSELEAGEDDDLLNILADMDAAINKAAYLLKAQPETPEGQEPAAEEASEPTMFDDEGME